MIMFIRFSIPVLSAGFAALLLALPAAAYAGESGPAGRLFSEKKYDEALVLFRESAKADPKDWAARLGVADCLAMLKRDGEAEAEYFALMSEAPRSELASGGSLVPLYASWWALYARDRRYAEAGEKLAGLARRLEGDLLTLQYLALAMHIQSKSSEALSAYAEILKRHGENEWARLNMGLILERMGRHGEAADSYVAAIALNPGGTASYPGASDAFERLNSICYRWSQQRRYAQARKAWSSVASLDALPAGRKAATFVNLGILSMNEGLAERAGGEFRKAMESDPTSADAANNIGLLMWSQGNLEGAKKEFSALVGEGGSLSLNGYENIGNLELRAGNPGRAVVYFEAGLGKALARLDSASSALKEALSRGGMPESAVYKLRIDAENAEYAVFRFRAYLRKTAELKARKGGD